MSQGLCPTCGADVDFPANQDEYICVSCGTSLKRLDAEQYFQNIKAIALVILGQFRKANAGHRIALEWHISKMASAIPFEQKYLLEPAMKWLEAKNAVKLITLDIHLIEITESGLNLLGSLENELCAE
jgi:DNA-directed RNA polymerase subunit RPC12/RpoP